ncbi:hypothetical protein [Aeromicrobium chenweiae]|uniref:Uncharacterized protein n=1 Tax=Aeromicrobium chenweiae TaxID=2079793 RepID=A0A2S0WK59_9ACTN|nr:hypothetical protein [Aeromicrobium chenweiae]AWB91723.1 hypothetical protein C3E78_05600 [Aeromicrobium chenweiae]TGN32564.1 hypothetical protein E4L97_07560 [Aeromicrobium chenweiae]
MKRRPRTPPPFSVTYVAISTDGSPDQMLTIRNNTEVSVVPTLRFVAYDVYGRELPHVVTQGVNGSHRGGPLLPAAGVLTDVLRFDGQGSHLVRGVRVELAAAEEVDHPALEKDVTSVMIDLEQKATADPGEFWGIGLVNPNPFGITMRISLLEFEEPQRDQPRQVSDVVTLQEDVDMASASNHVIWLPEDVRGQFHEVIHHLRMPTYA